MPNRRPPSLINFLIFFHPGHSYSNHKQEPSSCSIQNKRVNFTQDGDGEVAHGSAVSESNNNIEQDPMDAVRKDITSLKSFQETVVEKLYELEKALIISQQTNPNSRV